MRKKDKEIVGMDSLQRIIKNLLNDIIDLKKISCERSSYRRPWRPPFKRNTPPPNNQNHSPKEIQL